MIPARRTNAAALLQPVLRLKTKKNLFRSGVLMVAALQ
jgi:hypothetical protein